ncbi:MAG TPA: hypothetical protein VE443_11395 [Beijerinckiaceae bacterium]|jgi:hypothetical protein|nr:hypothetical protein [Beijerinckiaceae bacterium]
MSASHSPVMPSPEPLPGSKIDIHRRLTPTKEPCDSCREQMLKNRMAPPHGRLMIMSSGPLGDIFGGGVETRYVCLDCGNIVIHSTGRLGQGWH